MAFGILIGEHEMVAVVGKIDVGYDFDGQRPDISLKTVMKQGVVEEHVGIGKL